MLKTCLLKNKCKCNPTVSTFDNYQRKSRSDCTKQRDLTCNAIVLFLGLGPIDTWRILSTTLSIQRNLFKPSSELVANFRQSKQSYSSDWKHTYWCNLLHMTKINVQVKLCPNKNVYLPMFYWIPPFCSSSLWMPPLDRFVSHSVDSLTDTLRY